MTIKERLDSLREQITSEYLSGISTIRLGKKYGCSNASVYVALRRWSVPIRVTKTVLPHKEKIIELHLQGKTAWQIAKELSIPFQSVSRVIGQAGYDISHRYKKRDDPLKNHKEEIMRRYASGEGTYSIAKSFNCLDSSINAALRRYGVEIRDLRYYAYPVDETFFDKIDTKEKAYILGFWFADGCNMPQTPAIRISITDKDILQDMMSVMKYEGPIREINKRTKNGRVCKTQYSVNIGSRKLSDALTNLGCIRKKTYFAGFPSAEQVPEHLLSALILGWFDGDGCITYRRTKYAKGANWHTRIVGNEAVCRGIQRSVDSAIGVKGNLCIVHKGKSHNTWGYTVSAVQELKTYLDWLYKDATIFLNRKFEKYLEFCKFHGFAPVKTVKPFPV